MEYPGGKKATFSTPAILRFSSRPKCCWSSPGHFHGIRGRCHRRIYGKKMVCEVQKWQFWHRRHAPQQKTFWIWRRPSQSIFEGGKSPNKSWIGRKNKLRSKNCSQSFLFYGIYRKIGSLSASWAKRKQQRKSPSNCFSTSRPPSSNTRSQTALFVPNRHGRWEMVPIYKYEAKKGMGGSWRYAKAES